MQVARKVVGVGSVGTAPGCSPMTPGTAMSRCSCRPRGPPSVLGEYCGRSEYANQGERVVAGQRSMEAETGTFLGWTRITGTDGVDRDFYVRQLKDWKFSFPIEAMRLPATTVYARLCGWTLARAHARSGHRVALAAYLGGSAPRSVHRSGKRPHACGDVSPHSEAAVKTCDGWTGPNGRSPAWTNAVSAECSSVVADQLGVDPATPPAMITGHVPLVRLPAGDAGCRVVVAAQA